MFQDSSVDPDDDSDTGSEDESTHTITHPLEAEVRDIVFVQRINVYICTCTVLPVSYKV